jgi:hypothetical protein
MHRFLPVMVLFFHLNTHGQINQKKLDSLTKAIDSSARIHKSWQDSFTKVQDSIYHAAISKDPEQNSRSLNNFLIEQRRREAKEMQQAILHIVIGILLLIASIIAIARKRKTKT